METPMCEQIAIADLWCYQNATDEERNWKYISPTYKFDLSKIGRRYPPFSFIEDKN